MIGRHVRELETGDRVWFARRWRTVADVLPCPLYRVDFTDGAMAWLPPFVQLPCRA